MMHDMKKSLFLLSIGWLAASYVFADPIDFSSAKLKAEKLLNMEKSYPVEAERVTFSAEVNNRIGLGQNIQPAFYIFNSSDEKGFALIAGDDAFPAILGYSHEDAFPVDGDMPEPLAEYLEFINQYVEEYRNGEVAAPRFAAGESTGTVVVEPILSSRWGQEFPYNYLCPKGYVTGCVATSMSQIMYHWKWPEKGTGSVSYQPSEEIGVISSNFEEHTYQWDLMQDSYGRLVKPQAKLDAIAQLNYDAGVAMRMGYTASGSGTRDEYAMYAMHTYFGYKASTIKQYYRDCTATQKDWNNLIKKELDAGRPFQMSASSTIGTGGDAAGHSFLIDGYDSNDYVHVNWGWSGSGNGFYAITAMDVEEYSFVLSQSIVVGISPDYNGTDKTPPQPKLTLLSKPYTNSSTIDQNSSFAMNVDTLYNQSPINGQFTIGVGLFDRQGNYLENVAVKNPNYTFTLVGFYGFTDFPQLSCKVNGTYPDGDYYLRIVFKHKDYVDYVLPYMIGGDKENLIHALFTNGKIKFNAVSTRINDVLIDNNTGDNVVVNSEFFDMSGRKIFGANGAGIFIEKQILSDGTVKTIKRMTK